MFNKIANINIINKQIIPLKSCYFITYIMKARPGLGKWLNCYYKLKMEIK